MWFLLLMHACLILSAAQLVAAAVAIPAPADTPVLPTSDTVNDDNARNNADCIPGKTCDSQGYTVAVPTVIDTVINDLVTPRKIYGDDHTMTPITPVDMATRPHHTRPTQIVNEGEAALSGRFKRHNTNTPSTSGANTASTRRKPCGANICGGPNCPTGTAAWVTVAPINCLRIPVNTASALPTATLRKDYIVQPSQQSASKSLPTSPLMDYPKESDELYHYNLALLIKLNMRKSWYVHAKDDVSGKWYGFQDFQTAAGLARLHGCTVVFIVSKEGVYVSHIYESPIFVREPAAGKFVPTSDEFFQEATLGALVHKQKNDKSEYLDPISGLVGTKEKPGPLHFTNQPKIFVVTPFENGAHGPIMYPDKVTWLSDSLSGYLYPSGSEEYAQEPMTLPYETAPQNVSEDLGNSVGKAMMQTSKIVRYDRIGDKLIPVGRWRLWVNRIETVTWEFSGKIEKPIGQQSQNTDRPLYAGICPVSTASSSTSAPTSSSSSAQISTESDLPLPMPYSRSQIHSLGCIMGSPDKKIPQYNVPLIESLAKGISGIPAYVKFLDSNTSNRKIGWDARKYAADASGTKPWYQAEIQWAENCTEIPQNAGWPMELYGTADIIRDIFFKPLDQWDQCNNGTKHMIGRKMQYGCLMYRAWCNGCDEY